MRIVGKPLAGPEGGEEKLMGKLRKKAENPVSGYLPVYGVFCNPLGNNGLRAHLLGSERLDAGGYPHLVRIPGACTLRRKLQWLEPPVAACTTSLGQGTLENESSPTGPKDEGVERLPTFHQN